ncbi:hypothetical protein L596_019015 [Steinernema carpocapsae]|uniref:Uncharacterized protein n=1 Tax=Steinernema carpocapsae TaxID=34508 RepID=A0A4U5N7Y4_STECR|nr:hypothetical protein L596_019015 [Steinernema carpocapsae]
MCSIQTDDFAVPDMTVSFGKETIENGSKNTFHDQPIRSTTHRLNEPPNTGHVWNGEVVCLDRTHRVIWSSRSIRAVAPRSNFARAFPLNFLRVSKKYFGNRLRSPRSTNLPNFRF